MSRSLDEYSIAELRNKIGCKVKSMVTKNVGTLVFLSAEPDREDYTVNIDWDNGNKTILMWHFWLSNIVFDEGN